MKVHPGHQLAGLGCVTGDPSDKVARDLQLVEFVNQKTMGDTIESLLKVKKYSLHFRSILKVDKPFISGC